MADLINFEEFTNKYSDNILSTNSLLKNSPVISFVGDGTYTIDDNELDYSLHSNSFVYDSGLVDETTGTDIAFNFGDDLKYHSLTDQNTLFQFSVNPRLINLNNGVVTAPVTLKVNMYSGVVLLETFETIIDLKLLETNRHYTFGFFYNVPSESDVNFTFEMANGGFGVPKGRYIFAFSGFKVELDNRNLGLPTPYSLPKDYFTNPYSGWAYYIDSLATPTIVIGTTYTQITIDGLGASITNYLPKEIRGSSQLWAGSKITPISIGDDYDGRLDLTVTAKTGTPTLIELIIDISGLAAGTNKAFTGYIQTGGTIPYDQSLPLDFFTLSTFLTNGGKLYAKTDTGTISIGRRNIKITRKSKAF